MQCKFSRKSRDEIFWEHSARMMENNLLIVCLVLKKYGFGKKRMKDFLLDVMEQVDEINEMIRDDVLEDKRPELMAMVGEDRIREIIRDRIKTIMPEECWEMFYGQKLRRADVKADDKRLHKQPKISIAEAAHLQNTMLAMRDYGRDVLENNFCGSDK